MNFPMIAGLEFMTASATLPVYVLDAITHREADLTSFVLSDGLTLMGLLGPINGGFLP